MSINLNTAPYFDDYDQNNNYVKILFKPGYAVQARELTQLQSAILNQISAIGTHLFKEGSIVYNGRTSFTASRYFNFNLNTAVDIQAGDIIIGQTSLARAQVLFVEYKFTNLVSVWYEVLNGNNFSSSESVTVRNSLETVDRGSLTFSSTTAFNSGFKFSIDTSIFYIKNNFVHIPATSLYIYSNYLTARLGILSEEKIVTVSDDSTLLDPALGSSNYLAPGADRYQIVLSLDYVEYDSESNDPEDLVSEDFIELIRVRNNNIVRQVVNTDYNELERTLARRTYDESGDYTVSPFSAIARSRVPTSNEIVTNPGITEDSLGNVNIEVSAGKAYIKGFEFATTSPTNLLLEKARDTANISGAVAYYDHGDFIYVDKVSGDPSFTNHMMVNLRGSASNIVGNAFVSGIEYDSTVGNNVIYRLYLANATFIGSNTFGAVANVVNTATVPFHANISPDKYAGLPYITSSYNSTGLIKTPVPYVKTFLDGVGASDTVWDGKRAFTATFVSPVSNGMISYAEINNGTVNQQFVGSGLLSQELTKEDYYLVVETNTGTGPTPGRVLTYDDGIRVQVNSSSQLFISYSNTAPLLNFGTLGGNTVKVYSKLSLSSWPSKLKYLTSNTFVYTGNTAAVTVVLPNPDGYELTNVIASNTITSANADVTDFFTFFSGQRDSIYDFATVSTSNVLSNANVLTGAVNVDRLTVNYKYFSHSGSGFFTVDSYTHNLSNITYSLIPVYFNTKGEEIRLADVIDFRPVRNSSNTFVTDVVPVVDSDLNYDYTHYLGRKDRLVALSSKRFNILKGISSNTPEYPPNPSDGITLYTIDIGPYTFGPNDVKLNYVDNRRYTMQDIGKIDKRVERVEYYTALSLLEKQAKDISIPGSTPGIDKFKSGIIVDSFVDHTTGDPLNPDYKCSVDFVNRELRPQFTRTTDDFELESTTNLIRNDSMVVLAHSEVEVLSQKLASNSRRINPLGPIWQGVLKLQPASDNYVEKEYITFRANKTITSKNPEGVYSSLDGTLWNDWNRDIRGIDTANAGTVITSNNNVTVRTINNKLIKTSSAAFVRGRNISFTATSLLPDTELYVFTNSNKDLTDRTVPYKEFELSNTIFWVQTTENPISLSQPSTGYTANVALIMQNRVFVKDESSGITPSANATIILARGAQTVTTTLQSIVQPTGRLKTNSIGAVAGSIIIPDQFVPAGDVEIVLSNAQNAKGTTWAGAIYPAEGVLEKYADITVTTVRVIASPPAPAPAPAPAPSYSVSDTKPDDITNGKIGVLTCYSKSAESPIPTKARFISSNKVMYEYIVKLQLAENTSNVGGYTEEFKSNLYARETYSLSLPQNLALANDFGGGQLKFRYAIKGLKKLNDGSLVSDMGGDSSVNFFDYDPGIITFTAEHQEIVMRHALIVYVEVEDSIRFPLDITYDTLKTRHLRDGARPSLSSCPVIDVRTAGAPAPAPAPASSELRPFFWLNDGGDPKDSVLELYSTGEAPVGVPKDAAVVGYVQGDPKLYYVGVNPGNQGRPATFKLEWISIPGWTAFPYSLDTLNDPLSTTSTYTLTANTITRIELNTALLRIPFYYANTTLGYSPPEPGPGGTSLVRKGKLRLTVAETGAGARTASIESGVITCYMKESVPAATASNPNYTVTSTQPPVPSPAPAPSTIISSLPDPGGVEIGSNAPEPAGEPAVGFGEGTWV